MMGCYPQGTQSNGAIIVRVIHAGDTVEAYAARYDEAAGMRPKQCPHCGVVGRMIGHGCYVRRKPLQATADPPRPVKIRRWKCKACKHTTSLLPDVLHRYRHYVMAVIAQTLLWRYVLGWTWVAIQTGLSDMAALGMPSLDSLMRWGKAFEENALQWLNGMLMVLAVVRPQVSELDAHGSARPLQQVLQTMALLVQWLSNMQFPVGSEVSTNEISQAWGWGWNAGLGRLV